MNNQLKWLEKDKGIRICLDENTERRALWSLAARLEQTGDAAPWPDNKALAVWVLSLYRQAADRAAVRFDDAQKSVLAEKDGGNPLGMAALLLAAQNITKPDKDAVIAKLLNALEKTAAVTPTQLHFATRNQRWCWSNMGSTLRDNGMVLWALAGTKPDYPRLEALAFWLSQGLGEKKTLSTQEAMFGLLGLTAYLEHLGGNKTVSLKAAWNGGEAVTKSFSKLIDPPQTWRLGAKAIASDPKVAGITSGLELAALAGNPYWTARLAYASPSLPLKAENAGITLTRAWSKPGPYRMGDDVEVTLTLTVPAVRRHVLLFDPFPAGLEPLHASRADLQADDMHGGDHWGYPWQRRELRQDGLLLYAGEMSPGVYTFKYTLRAAAPGTFIRRPAYAEEMYTPEVFGRTPDEKVEVKE